jgi:hypothetical protein
VGAGRIHGAAALIVFVVLILRGSRPEDQPGGDAGDDARQAEYGHQYLHRLLLCVGTRKHDTLASDVDKMTIYEWGFTFGEPGWRR